MSSAPANIDPQTATSAILAAEAATEATVELLRFRREGMHCNFPFGDPEPVARLAEALLRTARIERDLYPHHLGSPAQADDYLSALNQLAGVCSNFLEDQCSLTVLEVETPE